MALPALYLILGLRNLFPDSIGPFAAGLIVVVSLAAVGWSGVARLVRGQVLSIREEAYIAAARAAGASRTRLLGVHILGILRPFLLLQSDAALKELAHLENRVNTYVKQLELGLHGELRFDDGTPFEVRRIDQLRHDEPLDRERDAGKSLVALRRAAREFAERDLAVLRNDGLMDRGRARRGELFGIKDTKR